MRWLMVTLGGLACSPTPGEPPAAPPALPPSAPPVAAADSSVAWSYSVSANGDASELEIEATFAPTGTSELTVDWNAEAYVHDVRVAAGDGWRALETNSTSWFADECSSRGCTVRYGYSLGELAREVWRSDWAQPFRGGVLTSPSAWLLRPPSKPTGSSYRFRVVTPDGLDFVSGVSPGREPGTYEATATMIDYAPYSAFGRFAQHSLSIGGGSVDVAIAAGDREVSDAAILAWIRGAATAVAGYFGRFPVERALVLVTPAAHGRVRGKQKGGGGASVLLAVGDGVTAGDLAADWKAAHEMVHLAVPNMPRRHLWLTEGLATYVEPIARARIGQRTPQQVWAEFVRGMPNGLPQLGDRGLDRTPTWGRTYWGGALFWLLADIEIRKRSRGKLGLPDALRGVVRAGGSTSDWWPIDRYIEACDSSLGASVVEELHRRHGSAAVAVDLRALWAELGVQRRGRTVSFDESAPLAWLRRSITAPR